MLMYAKFQGLPFMSAGTQYKEKVCRFVYGFVLISKIDVPFVFPEQKNVIVGGILRRGGIWLK